MLKRFAASIAPVLYSITQGSLTLAEEQSSSVTAYRDAMHRNANIKLTQQSGGQSAESATASRKETRVCQDPLDARVIACNIDGAWWDPGRKCYISLASPQPDLSHHGLRTQR